MHTYRRWVLLLALVLLCTSPIRGEDGAPPVRGTVAETMEAGRYTYIRITSEDGDEWVASSHVDVGVGDAVTVRGGHIMKGFESPTLNRTFDRIRFVESVQVGTNTATAQPAMPAGHPGVPSHGMGAAHGDLSQGTGIVGEIAETIDAGNYTYILVKSAEKSLWVATERFDAKVGTRVMVPGGMLSKNFESPILKRTFEEVLFADQVITEPSDAAAAATMAKAHTSAPTPAVAETIPQPEGALTVAKLVEDRATLAGQEVTVKGRVVKYTERVLDRNWLHITDGTSAQGVSDVTVNTTDAASKGEIVTVRGVVAVDQDLGHGYRYDVLIKDATITR